MKILMTNIDLAEIGGTQVWTETMATELKRQGHEVVIASPRIGDFAEERLSDFGVTSTPSAIGWDLCLVNHATAFGELMQRIDAPTIVTCHGPTHPLEQPAPGADHYVAVSEEVAEIHWPEYEMEVIRNPVDLERFRNKNIIVEEIVNFPSVLIATKNAEIQKMCIEGCDLAGYSYSQVNYQTHPVYEMERLMAVHDIVITQGRGVYEVLACNKSVICLSNRPDGFGGWVVRADGWVTEDNIQDLRQKNCSGRTLDMQWGSAELAENLEQYQGPETWGREYVEENNDVKDIAQQYLALVEEGVAA
jgi:hypothetical protein